MTSVFVTPRRPATARMGALAPSSAIEVAKRAWPQAITSQPEVYTSTPGPLFTTDQAAEYLQISVRSVKNLLGDGRIPFIKIGRVTRIHRDDLDGFIAKNRRRQRQALRPT